MTQHKTELERLARVMCEADGFNWGDQLDPMRSANGDDDGQAHYFSHARAVLQALSEPSEGMIEAGAYELGDGFVHADDRFWAKKTFTAMIKHILEEGESE